MPRKIRAAIIGCGVIAPTHIESYQSLPDVEVTCLCDIVPEKAHKLGEKYGIARRCASADEVFASPEVDVVSICTDHASHAPLVIAAFAAGKHVVCEKALCASTSGIEAVIAAHAQNPGLVFSGIFQHRFDPPVQMLKALLESGEMGELLTASVHVYCIRSADYYNADAWRGTWAHEGGSVLINQAIHFIDSLCWITGGIKSLCGQYDNRTHQGVIETEDTAVAALRFHNGALGTFCATSSSHINWESTLFVHGTKGSVELRDGRPLKIDFPDEERARHWHEKFANARQVREIEAGADHYGFGHRAQIADIVGAIREGRAPFVTGESAAHTAEVVLSLYRSCNERKWIDITRGI